MNNVLEPCENFFYVDGNTNFRMQCRHDKASHYSETQGGEKVYFSCLCSGCGCKSYEQKRGAK